LELVEGKTAQKYFFLLALLACPLSVAVQHHRPPSSPNGMINQTSELGTPATSKKQNQHQHYTPNTIRQKHPGAVDRPTANRCHARPLSSQASHPGAPTTEALLTRLSTSSLPLTVLYYSVRSRANVNILNAYQRQLACFFLLETSLALSLR
jgi:hypothetical protein